MDRWKTKCEIETSHLEAADRNWAGIVATDIDDKRRNTQ